MARVSYIDEKDHPELAELIAKIRGGRGGRLLNPYRMLLHSPEVANSWFEHVGAVRWKVSLDGQSRELVTLRVAILNGVDYVVKAHVPVYTEPEGLTLEQCDAIADWRGSVLFDDRQRAVLAYADAMTHDVTVPDSVFAELKRHFDERQIVEMTVLIGTYNMHTRVLRALEVDPQPADS